MVPSGISLEGQTGVYVRVVGYGLECWGGEVGGGFGGGVGEGEGGGGGEEEGEAEGLEGAGEEAGARFEEGGGQAAEEVAQGGKHCRVTVIKNIIGDIVGMG